MQASAAFLELFIAGVQGCIWVLLLVLSRFALADILAVITRLDHPSGVVAVCGFAFCYTLGITIDQAAGILFVV